MKKKYLKYAIFSIFLFLSILGVSKVNAEQYTGQAIWPSEKIPNIYIKKFREDGYIKYQQAAFIRRSEDNKFVYCLQPYVDIDNNLPYYNIARRDFAAVLNITEEQWDRVSLLAHYGYGYNVDGYNHSDQKWYAITQVLIWRTVEPKSRIVFTDTLNGNELPNKFASEIAELESLLDKHYKRPNFNMDNLSLAIGESITLTDSNEVLSRFKISSTENVSATINGNTLTLTATGIGNAKVNVARTSKAWTESTLVYYSNHSQNVFRVGYFDPVPALFNLKVVGGKVEFTKKDSSTKLNTPQGDGLLSNAVYGIYNLNGEKIVELTTNNDGYAISGYLPSLGDFYLEEITPSKGYTLDRNKYYFTLTEDHLLESINVYEKIISNNITLFKVFANENTGIMTPEENITFDIYLKSNNSYYKSITTDKNGYANIELPYGTWIFKQKNSTPNYEKVEDFELVVDENTDSYQYKLISNAEITARLKVIKIDKDTKEVIKRSGIKFKIKSLKTNDYICQTITYPKAKTICEYETDENGVLITPYPLLSGNYVLEEVDQVIDGYVWNRESMPFEIGENSNLITDNDYGVLFETKFENKKVKGQITIYKTGERTTIIDNNIESKQLKLWGVKFGLFDTNNNLIKEAITNEGGKVVFDNLELGTYIIKELKVNNKYILDDKEYKIELKYKDQYTEIIKEELKLENYLKKGTFEFTKLDESNNNPIPNTVIELFIINEEESISLGEYETNENGKVIIEDLPLIYNYFIVEKEASEGYVLNEEPYEFRFTNNDEIIKYEMTNKKIKSTIKVLKIDESETPLKGVIIGVFDLEGNLLKKLETNEEGLIELELEYGKYYYQELETIDGYILNNEKVYFDVVNDNEIIESTLINKLEEVKVPSTNLDRSYSIYIYSTILAILGLGMLIYDRKNKK